MFSLCNRGQNVPACFFIFYFKVCVHGILCVCVEPEL